MQKNKRLELIKNAKAQAFSKPILKNYHFKSVTLEKFWHVYATDFHAHSPLDLFFEEDSLRTSAESNKLQLINEPNKSHLIEDNYLLLDANNNTIAMFRGWQKSFDCYYMQFTAVHKKYRRKGVYSSIIDRVLEYTKLLGFSRVLSWHAPFNNAVLIAKLKKNFKIIGMDIDAAVGINIWLCYFHNPELEKAFEFRCGNLIFSDKLFSASLGTAEQLSNVLMKSKNKLKSNGSAKKRKGKN